MWIVAGSRCHLKCKGGPGVGERRARGIGRHTRQIVATAARWATLCAILSAVFAVSVLADNDEISTPSATQTETSAPPLSAVGSAPKEVPLPISIQAAGYFEGLDRSLDRLQKEELAHIHDAAGAIAARFIAKPELFVYDSIGSFVSEAAGRAGGLMDITGIRDAADASAKLSDASALVIGARSPDDAGALAVAQAAKAAGALVIAICPAGKGLPGLADHFLDDKAPGDMGTVPVRGASSPVSPTVGVLNVAVLWSLTGQTIQDLLEAGYVPRVYLSIQLPGGTEYDNKLRSGPALTQIEAPADSHATHDRANEYLAKAREAIATIRAQEMDKMAAAADAAAKAVLSGHKAFHFDIGHMWPQESATDRAGNPGVFGEVAAAYDPKPIQPGDFLLWGSILGGFKQEVTSARQLRESGVSIALIYVPSTPEQGIREDEGGKVASDYANIAIEGHYPYADGCLSFAEIPAPACPLSGFVNFSTYWAIAAQTAANLLAASAPEGGPPPAFTQAVKYLDEIDKSLAQLEQAENVSRIHAAASAIADRLVSGGGLFIYDRFGSLSDEALRRAGGLMDIDYVFNAASATKNLSDSSVLLIGARTGDDTAALGVLQAAKAAGALVVAICPAGRGLPVAADHFLDDKSPGDMGVIRLPGASSPVSPTCGVLNTVVLWSLIGQTVQDMIEAGYVSRVFKSMQVPGANDYNKRLESEPVLRAITPPSPPRAGRDRAMEYLSKARALLSVIEAEEMNKIAEAASLATKAILDGHKAYYFNISHGWPGETALDRAGNPGIFAQGPASYNAAGFQSLQPGDFLLWSSILGALNMEVPAAREASSRGVVIACSYIPTTPEQAIREDSAGKTVADFATVVMNGHFPYTDGCLNFDEIDTPACPISGFVNFSLYWGIAAQTAADLLEAGRSLEITK